MFSPSAIADFLACSHLTFLENERALGRAKKPYFADPGAELLSKLGLEHEQKYLNQLKNQGLKIVEVRTGGRWEDAAAETKEAMVQGADVIYQATFLQDQWRGRADFLLRVDSPSNLGAWSYEVVETKLAKTTKARALIQLCFYSELVGAIQGEAPERMHVVLGRGAEPEAFSVRRYLAYFRKVKREFEASVTTPQPTYPEPVELCGVCDWFLVCDERWHRDDHLSLVAGITRNQRNSLIEREIKNVKALAGLSLPVVPKIERIAPAPLLRIREQARVQVRGRNESKPVYEFIESPAVGAFSTQTSGDAETQRGFSALPVPSPGDVFLDFESDPFAFDQGIEYLIGTLTIAVGQPSYNALWSFDPAQEKNAFIEFIDKVKQIRQRYPDMHVYHYSPYEQTAIKHLAGRHGVCTDEVDELLRAEVFVDLFRVVRQGIRASVESYSIKKMEQFYGFTRTVELRDATSALQAIESVFALGDDPASAQETLKTIADYNRDDCVSTLRLRDWLELLRVELETKLGTPLPRPELKSGAPGEDLAAQLTEIAALKERLVAGLPEEKSDWTKEQRAGWLLAQLLEWHRREEKSMWWEYYRLCDLSDEELIEDKGALGGLEYLGVVEETKRSFVHRYKFPTQDHAIDRARSVHDPQTKNSAGTKVGINEINRTIDLKRDKKSDKPHPKSLIADNYISSEEQVKSLIRLARWVVDNGLTNESSEFQAARDALLHRAPRLTETTIDVLSSELSPLEAAKRAALSIDHSILPIQGPPGSGKTFTGAHMIIELIQAGKRVGITAGSHKVISNLLDALCEEANKMGQTLKIIQKSDKDKHDSCGHNFVIQEDKYPDILKKLQTGEAQVLAGTPWLWARAEFAGSVDVLFVDEAGQMSLANVLAVSQAAKSVVLLGDPQQLDQPQKGVHPPGAEVSALSHLLNGRATIESHRGLFLGESWRLHPDICAFTSEAFYEGRLRARAENTLQRLNTSNMSLAGTGLRFVSARHNGNQSDSAEEVEVVASMTEALLHDKATWITKEGETRLLTWDDILIVAPYNAQVALLKLRLPDAKVGTVDKFQGQEAPVVFYSMATSTPEDAPRGMEFLYSANRLNVATSRAQCVTVLVASSALFDVSCKTPKQMELANAFCRYLEMAVTV